MGADARDRTGGSLTCARLARRTWARGGIAGGSAFTLIEILLAVALLGLLSAAMVSVAGHLADGRPKSPQEVFWEATRVARRTALKTEAQVRLSYDAKAKAFVLDAKEGARNFPVPEVRDLTIDFLQAQSTGGALLVGGQLVDTQTIPAVSFFPDGTCTPFRVQFRTNGPAHIVAIDPWTCAPVLSEPKKT